MTKKKRPKLWGAMRSYRQRYTHVLSALIADKNLAMLAQKRKEEAGRP